MKNKNPFAQQWKDRLDNKKKCPMKYLHDFPDYPCKVCSPKEYKKWSTKEEKSKSKSIIWVGVVCVVLLSIIILIK